MPFKIKAEEANAMKPLLISYQNDVYAREFFLPILKKAYENLRIDATFVEVNVKRGIRNVINNKFDGDVARLKLGLESHPALIFLEPAWTNTEINLYCRKGILCNKNILNDRKNIIGTVTTIERIEPVLGKLEAAIHTVDDFDVVVRMFNGHRFDFFLWLSMPDAKKDVFKGFDGNTVLLKTTTIHHVLNAKHTALEAKVNAELSSLLQANIFNEE